MKVKVSDYIADWLVEKGIKHVFTVTGGGAMHLNNSLGKNPGLKCVYNHHEQASAVAAEGYARVHNRPALVCVTSGPGGTNAITGVLGGWLDSIPMLIISGQVRYDTTVRGTGLKLRQVGDQEFDITKCVSTMTKYAEMVSDPLTIRYHLERALYLAVHGRPGPCWLDIPLNVQGATVDTEQLKAYDSAADSGQLPPAVTDSQADAVIAKLLSSKRPVIYAGSAITMKGISDKLVRLAEVLDVPVVTGFNAHECIESGHRLFAGRPGTIGDRPGNFAVQNSDLLLVLGCRLNIRQTGYYWTTFARAAYKISVDIDPNEFDKPNYRADMGIHGDVEDFIDRLTHRASSMPAVDRSQWVQWCARRREKYPVVLDEYWKNKGRANPYCLMSALSDALAGGDIVVAANATATICSFQTVRIKKGQRIFSNSGSASMGYDLPAALGAWYAGTPGRVVCLAGDGSLQMNIQELQTVKHNGVPLKLFYLNNHGYHSIRQTQNNFFGKPLVGCEPENGVSFPDMKKVSAAYGIRFIRCRDNAGLKKAVEKAMSAKGAVICEVLLDPCQPFAPRASSKKLEDGRIVSRPLEDMAPFLSPEELRSNMLIEPVAEQ